MPAGPTRRRRTADGPALMLEKRIEIRWRDVDAYGHVNNAVYLNYLEEARDAWVQAVLGPSRAPRGTSSWPAWRSTSAPSSPRTTAR